MSSAISQSLLPEFDHEVATTRRVLERVPEDRPDFRPHPTSMTLARLAGNVAEIPLWAVMTLGQDELDFNSPGAPLAPAGQMTTCAALLAGFDKQVGKARALPAATSDASMMETWTLKSNG